MTSAELVREILSRDSLSPTSLSIKMGHNKTYLNTIIARDRELTLPVLREFCEAAGYELVVRSNEDGYEFEI